MRIFALLFLFASASVFGQNNDVASLEESFVNTAYISPKKITDHAYIGFWQNPDLPFTIEISNAMGIRIMTATSDEVNWTNRGLELPIENMSSGIYTCRLATSDGHIRVLNFRIAK